VDDDVDTVECTLEPHFLSDVSEKKSKPGRTILPIEPWILAHLVLLEFVPTQDRDATRLVVLEQGMDKLLAKRARPASYQYGFLIEKI
jgi:hypothetical protein